MHACETLMRSQPATVDPKVIKQLVGAATVESMPAVARAFGLAANTIRQSWKPAGMPGEPGNYSLAAIVVWRLQYEQRLAAKVEAAKTGKNTTAVRLSSIEKRLAALEEQNNK